MSNANFTRVVDRPGRIANVFESNLVLSAKLISTEVNLGVQQYLCAGSTSTGAVVTGGLTGGDLYYDQTGYVRIVWN